MNACVDGVVIPALRAVRTCVASRLGQCDRGVCRFPIVFNSSQPPADACTCECPDDHGSGQAWVRMESIEQDSSARPGVGCFNGQYTLTLAVGLYRCYPVPTEREATLPEDIETDAAEALYLDAAILRHAVLCCDWLADRDMTPVVKNENPIGPSGGCVGIELQFTVPATECPCPEKQHEGVGW